MGEDQRQLLELIDRATGKRAYIGAESEYCVM